jgi:hypothetical protein
MAVDLSGYRSYRCHRLDCRHQCLRPADSEESLRNLCVNCLRNTKQSEVDLLDDLDLGWFLAQLDQDQKGGPGTRPPSHGGSTRKPTASARPEGRAGRECGSPRLSDGQSRLTDFPTEAHGD